MDYFSRLLILSCFVLSCTVMSCDKEDSTSEEPQCGKAVLPYDADQYSNLITDSISVVGVRLESTCLMVDFSYSGCERRETDVMVYLDQSPFIPILNNSAGDFIFPFPVDPGTSIVGHRQEGECLILDTRFGGGCEEHCIYLYVDLSGQTAINAATTFQARLSHNNTDQCEALVAFEAKVDISFFKTLEFEEINLQIMDYEELIVLEF